MGDWLGVGLIALGTGVFGSGIWKRRKRARTVVPAGAIRPEFAVMGEIVRPLLLFFIAFFALKMCLFYFVLGGQTMLSPLNFGAILYLLICYGGYVVLVTTKPVQAPAAEPGGVRSPA